MVLIRSSYNLYSTKKSIYAALKAMDKISVE